MFHTLNVVCLVNISHAFEKNLNSILVGWTVLLMLVWSGWLMVRSTISLTIFSLVGLSVTKRGVRVSSCTKDFPVNLYSSIAFASHVLVCGYKHFYNYFSNSYFYQCVFSPHNDHTPCGGLIQVENTSRFFLNPFPSPSPPSLPLLFLLPCAKALDSCFFIVLFIYTVGFSSKRNHAMFSLHVWFISLHITVSKCIHFLQVTPRINPFVVTPSPSLFLNIVLVLLSALKSHSLQLTFAWLYMVYITNT